MKEHVTRNTCMDHMGKYERKRQRDLTKEKYIIKEQSHAKVWAIVF